MKDTEEKSITVNFSIVSEDGKGFLPYFATDGASGFDLFANVPEDSEVIIRPSETSCIGTGVAIEIPPGFSGLVCPRSGLSLQNGITILNAPGVIDNDYRGEIKILLINFGTEPFVIIRGMRIAQMLILRAAHMRLQQKDRLSETSRGSKGFGSTGTFSISQEELKC